MAVPAVQAVQHLWMDLPHKQYADLGLEIWSNNGAVDDTPSTGSVGLMGPQYVSAGSLGHFVAQHGNH